MLPTPSTPNLPESIYPPAEDSYLLLDTLSSASETAFLKSRFASPSHTGTTSLSSQTPSAQAPPPPASPSDPSPAPLVVDLGTGSGILLSFVLANAATLLGRSDVLGLGVDVNPDACRYVPRTVAGACAESRGGGSTAGAESGTGDAAHGDGEGEVGGNGGVKRTGTGTYLTALNASLLSTLRTSSVDILLFNPPYVPTSEVPPILNSPPTLHQSPILHQSSLPNPSPNVIPLNDEPFARNSHLLSLSYCGGRDGMEVTEQVLADLPRVLSERGVAYVLLCKANGVEAVIGRVRRWGVDGNVDDLRGEGGREGEGEGEEGGGGRHDGNAGMAWSAEIVGRSGKVAGWEKLVVVRIWRSGVGAWMGLDERRVESAEERQAIGN